MGETGELVAETELVFSVGVGREFERVILLSLFVVDNLVTRCLYY